MPGIFKYENEDNTSIFYFINLNLEIFYTFFKIKEKHQNVPKYGNSAYLFLEFFGNLFNF